jgi:transposase
VISEVGALLGTRDFPATAAGHRALLTWARTFGAVLRAGVEGTSSYGAALNRTLRREGVTVIEVNRPDRADRRHRDKTDAVDAEAAARAVLSGRARTPHLARINAYLVRWIRKKYKRLRAKRTAFRCWRGIVKRFPRMFAHWEWVPAVPSVW